MVWSAQGHLINTLVGWVSTCAFQRKAFKQQKKIIEFFKDLELRYEYLSEENPEYESTYSEISKFVGNLKSLVYKISSPHEILNKARKV